MALEDSTPSAKRVVATSFAVHFVDLLINATVAVLTGSAVLLAESLQAVSDIASTAFLYIGVLRSRKPRDGVHQYGHGRELYFWTLMTSLVMLLASGIPSFILGLKRVLNPEPVSNVSLAYLVLTVAFFTNLYSFRMSFKRLMGGKRKLGMVSAFMRTPRVETKASFVLDSVAALAAISGLLSLAVFGLTGETRFDGVGAMLIGLFTIALSILLVMGVRDFLLGRRASPSAEKKIRLAIKEFPKVKKIIDLKTMYIGPDTILVSTEIYLKKALSALEVEKLVEALQEGIEKRVPEARFVQIQVETPKGGKKARMVEKKVEEY